MIRGGPTPAIQSGAGPSRVGVLLESSPTRLRTKRATNCGGLRGIKPQFAAGTKIPLQS